MSNTSDVFQRAIESCEMAMYSSSTSRRRLWDAETEFEVFKGLPGQASARLVLFVSHRFSTVRLADRILVMEEGACVEGGSHRELMRLNGRYAHWFRIQAHVRVHGPTRPKAALSARRDEDRSGAYSAT